MNPKHPIYIVSKGRADVRMTSDALHRMGVPHFMIVEEQERVEYEAQVADSVTLLTLDKRYQQEYNTCDDLGDGKSKGSGAARNFAWEHSVGNGFDWHWVIDDNISGFFRLHHNLKTPVADGTIFRVMEDFVERYENVAMAGPNYFMFVPRKYKQPPFVTNTRIYSCNLIRNNTGYCWRARYNEDTDLSLRMLKDGWCTVLFNAFLQYKMTTQSVKGGNTTELYGEGTLPKSEMLVALHPDVSRLVWKFGRVHHHVDYRRFKVNRLRRKPGIQILEGIDDYGMVLQQKIGGEWTTLADAATKLSA